MKRRTFLQQAGWVLAALGVSETGLFALGGKSFALPLVDRYYQALAQPSARKLALLVGINQYPRTALSGCVTDVEMQRELLIHRFSFNPSDILTLTDRQATRQDIETAFLEHLIKQAAVDDVVLFHFSGYGSRINLTAQSEVNSEFPIQNPKSQIQNSLVPVDGVLGTKQAPAVNNLLEETLLLLLRSLATDRVTTVLDTSYTNEGTVLQGNLRIRSHPGISSSPPTPGELTFQSELLRRLNTSRNRLDGGEPKGIVLAASEPTQPATEADWGGFSAGLFTYALTQHLWQATPQTTVQVSLSRAAEVVEQLVGKEQEPTISGQKSQEESLLAYNITPYTDGADGVAIAVEDNGKTAQLWLAGLPTRVLAYYGVNSLLTLVDSQAAVEPSATSLTGANEDGAAVPLLLQIRAREGLRAKARLVGADALDTVQVGQLVQEYVRVLPRNIGLTVALDSSLERIERVDATSAFANVAQVQSVVAAGEQPADYLFGKVRNLEASGEKKDLTQLGSTDSGGGYGLFSLGGELIPNTVGEVSEAVKSAINRLRPKLNTLLAAKLWRLSVNEASSGLGVAATLEMLSPTQQVLIQRGSLRAPKSRVLGTVRSQLKDGIPTLPLGSSIGYRVQNYSSRPIYFMLLGLDPSSSAIAFYPLVSSPGSLASDAAPLVKNAVIPAGQTLRVPQPEGSFKWIVQEPRGLVETYLICSRAPFTQTLAAMAAAMRPKGETERIGDLYNPLDVARALLQDLHLASAIAPETIGTSSDTYALDVNAWATLSFIYQVV